MGLGCRYGRTGVTGGNTVSLGHAVVRCRFAVFVQAWAIPTVGEQGPGQQSTIETATVRMQLNHDSGQLDGRVITGPHQGSALSKLRQEQLIDLLKHCQKHDFDSVPLLEAYLDRYFEHWRQQKEQPSDDNFDSGEMTKQQAYSILGLEPGASAENIRTTHKRLIQRLHPDRGGSAYLAAKINQAKDSLLK